MDIEIVAKFSELWGKYFDGAGLPIAFYYTDEKGHAELPERGSLPRCLIGAIAKVREGNSYTFDAESIGCFGGRRYLGFAAEIMDGFEYFLSCGIPGKLRGERYKKSPELVREMMKNAPAFRAPARYVVFKRWDKLEKPDDPEVVIFFAQPDVLSGLFSLSAFDEAESNGVFAPFGSGCSSIVLHPYLEKDSARPRAVIGMFDPSARPFVPADTLTFAVPVTKFYRMIDNMEESFLTTPTWKAIRKRIGSEKELE